MTATPILHHYPSSPFSEKIRLALGLKGIRWQSVRIPAVMPKPDVVALTGGFRKTPLLQLGNHVFCDTARISRELERIAPQPSLYEVPTAEPLAAWFDSVLFNIAVPLALRPSRPDGLLHMLTERELARFGEDRQAMSADRKLSMPHPQTARSHLPVVLRHVEKLLGDHAYLLGDSPSIADLSCYHSLWFLDLSVPELVPDAGPIRSWMQRVAAIGHGVYDTITSEEALSVCRSAEQDSEQKFNSIQDGSGLAVGQRVQIRAEDYGRDPVVGELVKAGSDELVLRRTDPRAGTVFVHFPRLGYAARAAAPNSAA